MWKRLKLAVSSFLSDRSSFISFVMDAGLVRTGRLFGAARQEFKQRYKLAVSDFLDGLTMKSLSASLFMFCTVAASTIALAELARRETDGAIGVTEYLLMNCVAGVVHALFATQPLLVLRPTGPITAVIIQLSVIAKATDVDFWELMSWTGVWLAVYMAAVAALDGCALIRHLSRFTHDLFSAFVCTVYLADGLTGVIDRLKGEGGVAFDVAVWAALLSLCTFTVAMALNGIKSTPWFTRGIRGVLHDYSLAIGLLVTIALSYSTSRVDVDRIPLPDKLEPTAAGRDWWVGLSLDNSPSWTPVLAAGAAVPILLLFFIDQNVSSRLTQIPEMELKKGAYYNSSFLVMAALNLAPLFGLPFVTGSLPHSPQFAKALTTFDDDGRVVRVAENRLAPFAMYLALGLALLVPSAVDIIPDGAVDGILAVVGVAGLLQGNQFVNRVKQLVTDPELYPTDVPYAGLPARRVHTYTAVQLGLFVVLWLVKVSPAGLAFPLVIVCLVPFRSNVVGALFTEEELAALDSAEHPEEAYLGTEGDVLSPTSAGKGTGKKATSRSCFCWRQDFTALEDLEAGATNARDAPAEKDGNPRPPSVEALADDGVFAIDTDSTVSE